MTRILACGSREYGDWRQILDVLAEYKNQDTVVIHGACPRGADLWVDKAARSLGYDVRKFPAEWDKYVDGKRLGKRAGPIRNIEMLKQRPDVVLAFGDGRGTRGVVRGAERKGIPVRRFP